MEYEFSRQYIIYMTTGTGVRNEMPAFLRAVRNLLGHLNEEFPMSAWLVTRKNDDEWIVFDVDRNPYGLSPRDVYSWQDSICHQMILEGGDPVVPAISIEHPYSQAPICQVFQVKSYAGALLYNLEGDVWGTLTGVNQTPLPESAVPTATHLRSCGDLLMQLYESELSVTRVERRALEITTQGWRDTATGAFNQKAYDFDIRGANQLAQSHMIPGGVIVVNHNWSPFDTQTVVRDLSTAHPNKCRAYLLKPGQLVILMSNVYEPLQHAILDTLQREAPVATYGYAPRLHGMTFDDAQEKAEQLADLLKVA